MSVPRLLLTSLAAPLLVAGLATAQQPLFEPDPIWTLEDLPMVPGVCGDIDRDGRCDLVIADASIRGSIFELLNTGATGILAMRQILEIPQGGPMGGWQTVECLALGDVDADGDLDLAIGSKLSGLAAGDEVWSVPTVLIRNQGDGLASYQTAEQIGPEANRQALALADLDGDGDLDFIGGNSFPLDPGFYPDVLPDPDVIHLYDGELGGYQEQPIWSSATRYSTLNVLLGDLDGDGDRDLLFGTATPRLGIWLDPRPDSPPSIFHPEPDREVLPAALNATAADYRLGDVDGDGDLDLVRILDPGVGNLTCGVHLNRFSPEGLASFFPDTAAWTAPATSRTISLALGDLDGDGDLDLVRGTLVGAGTDVFLNTGSAELYGATSDWSCEPTAGTSVRLFDADGDGDLDLLAANSDGTPLGARLYRNLSPRLEVAARATLVAAAATRALALGDVNGDGYPDLVCGNDGYTQLHLNLPGLFPGRFFSPAAAWTVPFQTRHTQALALGDVDGDGRPDLVLGNRNEESFLYLGAGTGFASVPAWNSPSAPTRATTSLALGDVDGDGYLDLVRGNLGQPDELFHNDGGGLTAQPTWTTTASLATRSLALADIDGDGRPDLVCGADGAPTVAYHNTGSAFTAAPTWQASADYRTRSVALGDVNGDGRPELACGNLGQPNTVYVNLEGRLLTFPLWESDEGDSTTSIAFADVDADGWLDLVCGGPGRATCWYRNRSGRLSETATWRAEQARATTALALADLDKDGDLDLVCGNDGQAPSLHLGRRNPLYLHDLTHPTHHTDNIPVHIRDVDVDVPARNLYRIAFTVADAESDPAWLRLQWRYADESGWRPMLGGEIQGPLAAAPAGTRHTIDWDVTLLDIERRPVVLELVSIEMPRALSVIRQRTAYDHALGIVDVRRAVVQADTAATFPAVTLGDTVQATLTLRSVGNEPLQVSGITLPSAEMWREGPAAFTVPTGQAATVTIHLGPRESLQAAGDIVVQTDAPLTPVLSIPVRATIEPLAVLTEALLVGETAPLGEALTVQSIRQTRVERCTLRYRPQGGELFTAQEMERFGDSFRAVIPGQDVTERGLEYYILMENGGVTATDPAGAPGAALHTVEVALPAAIVSAPVPTSGQDFLAGRGIPVQVTLPEGALFQSGWLFYRRGGETAWDSTAVAEALPLPAAVIPDSAAGSRGVEYWLRVSTGTAVLTDPPLAPDLAPRAIRVKVPSLTEPASRAAGQYSLASFPLDFGADYEGTLEVPLGSLPAYGAYDPLRWRCFRWQPAEGRYLELGGEAASELQLRPGRSYWLISREAGRIATAGLPGWSVPTDGPFAITVEPGWNQVANPFAFPVSWDGALVDGEPWVPGPVSTPYVRTAGGYQTGEGLVLEPFSGFWVLNEGPTAVTLGITPVEAAAAQDGAKSAPSSRNDLTWSLTISASCAEVRDLGTVVAVTAGAAEGRDDLDRPRPPAPPGRSLWVCLPQEDGGGDRRSPRPLLRDVRDEAAGGWMWALDVAKTFADDGLADEVALRIEGAAALPAGLEAVLLDTELGRAVDLRREPGLRFNCGVRPATDDPGAVRFRLIIGDAGYVAAGTEALATPPAVTALLAPRPNPFNPATLLRYDLASPQRVRLNLYDASGRLVRTLVDGPREAGRHETVWRGEDARGRRVAAGVYFARLETGRDGASTRKLTLLK